MAGESKGYTTAQELFCAARRRSYTDVEIPGFGRFRLRTINAEEAAQLEAEQISPVGKLSRRGLITRNARIIQLHCVDANGELLFTRDDIVKIQQLPAGEVAELSQACRDHSGLDDAEDAEKN